MHIDVNNAFLSWTAVYLLKQGYKYDIRDSYAVIGGDEQARHGIVLAKSIPAKKMGIVTAETLGSARKKCPSLRIYPPNFTFYEEMSNALFKLLSNYTPDIEVASIDECYLDYGKIKSMNGEPYDFAVKIQKQIYDTLGFTVNIGIANNKLCAKMASDFSKPNKIHTLYDDEVKNKMWPLPIDELFGIGKKTSPKLKSIGINTIGDLANYNLKHLQKYFKNQASRMVDMAKGIDDSEVISIPTEAKCISNSTTFPRNITNIEEAYRLLLPIAENVSMTLRKQDKYAYVVAVIMKNSTFVTYNHQSKLANPTNLTNEIYNISKRLLKEMWNEEPIRLLGIRLDHFVCNYAYQVSLFDKCVNPKKDEQLEKIVDSLKEKYGTKVICYSSTLKDKNSL